jgi:DHA1 family multidrug resistance protein-like MFS transporter
MRGILRDSTFGHINRFLSKSKAFHYPEEVADFDFSKYLNSDETDKEQSDSNDELSGGKNKDIESALSANGGPMSIANGNVTIGWYGEDDQENPQNWSNAKRY